MWVSSCKVCNLHSTISERAITKNSIEYTSSVKKITIKFMSSVLGK